MSKKQILFIVAFLVLVIIGWSVYLLIPKSYVLFQTAPEVVYIKINGEEEKIVNNGDKLFFKPDKYQVVIYRDEFNPQFEEFTIKNGENKEIVVALMPLTDNAIKLLQNNSSSKVIEKSTASRIDIESSILEEKYPILKILPIESRNYTILSCRSKKYPDQFDKIAICIDITGAPVKDRVEEEMISKGYDLDDYEVIWRDISF